MPLRPRFHRSLPAILLALAALAPAAGAAQAAPTGVELKLSLEDGGAAVTVHQTWTGESARSLREALDVYFGAADGILTESELSRIADATRADMVAKPLPWITTGGDAWTIKDAVVAFEGAEGRTSSIREVSTTHEIALAAPAPGIVEEVTLAPPWPVEFAIELPDGRRIAGDGAPGSLPAQEPVTLRVEAAPASGAAIGTGLVVAIVGLGLLLALLLVAGAYVILRRTRARRGQPAQ